MADLPFYRPRTAALNFLLPRRINHAYNITMFKQLQSALHLSLSSHGFVRKGSTWNRKRGDFVDVISLQKSKGSSDERQSIAVNAGVGVPEFEEAIFRKSLRSFTEAQCVIIVRPGELRLSNWSTETWDVWWDLTPDNLQSRIDEIETVVTTKVIPFLERFAGYDEILIYLKSMKGWQATYFYTQLCKALVYWKVGDRKNCEITLLEVVQFSPELVDNIQKWIEKQSADI